MRLRCTHTQMQVTNDSPTKTFKHKAFSVTHFLNINNPVNPSSCITVFTTLPEEFIPWHALTHHSSTGSCPSSCFAHSTHQSFAHAMFLLLRSLVCQSSKPYAVWTLEVFSLPPTGFPAGHFIMTTSESCQKRRTNRHSVTAVLAVHFMCVWVISSAVAMATATTYVCADV